MKTQATLLLSIVGILLASNASAGNCSLVRMYKDSKKIMQHMSTQTLSDGVSNTSSCSTACRRQAEILPVIDSNTLKNKKAVSTALLRCTYSDNYGGRDTNGKIIGESTVPITRLRSDTSSLSQRVAPLIQTPRSPHNDVVRMEIAHPEAPTAPSIKPVEPVGNYPQPTVSGERSNASGSQSGSTSAYGAANSAYDRAQSTYNNGTNMRSGGYVSRYDRPRNAYDHPSLHRQLQALGGSDTRVR